VIEPCTCEATHTNPHATLKRESGLPAHCTSPDPCGACGGAGCDACQMRGYSQHCERAIVDAVELAGWDARARGLGP
jgi:hypothetical protein